MNAKHTRQETEDIIGKAAWDSWHNDWHHDCSSVKWEDLVPDYRKGWIRVALAVIEAYNQSFVK